VIFDWFADLAEKRVFLICAMSLLSSTVFVVWAYWNFWLVGL
jgi:hypothetical protein